MLEIILFLLLGIVLGIIMGLIPGIHPNMIILMVPIISMLNIDVLSVISFLVAMGVTNSVVDFIPSLFLGAPEGGNELSVLPGHRMLISGRGYEALKLTVMGGVGAVIFVAATLPALIFAIPPLFEFLQPYIYLLLLAIVLLMVLTENKIKGKITAAVVFIFSGIIGVTMNSFPIDSTLTLFPIFSGFFGVSLLVMQIKQKTKIPEQKLYDSFVSRKSINKSVVFGSLGGIVSGFLPGIGSSEIATIATVDKNDRSFLVTIGALTTANIILSILSLWLISRPRSGLAVALDQLAEIGFNEVIFIVAVSLISVGIAAIVTMKIGKSLLLKMNKINYSLISKSVILLIIVFAFLFTGLFGLFLLFVCTMLGIFTNLVGVKRGNLMGVLILPTMIFYAGF